MNQINKKKKISLFGLPEKVVFCKTCVNSNQRPSHTTEFEQIDTSNKKGILIEYDGICSACKYAKEKEKIDWKKREEKLLRLLDKYRRKSGYDVIVPGSGGKDSGFASHILKYKYGMNPLTVTWAPHLYTDIGWKNFQNWVHVGGHDNFLYTPNGKLHRYLTSQAFKNLLHPFQPFIIGQKLVGPLISTKFKIPLVMYGESNAENGSDIKEAYTSRMENKFFSNNQDLKKIRLGGMSIKEIMKEGNFKMGDFTPYLPLNKREVFANKTEVHHLGYFLKWDYQESFYYSSRHNGFMPNDERTEGTYSKYTSIDDKIDNFHYFTTYIKFGIGRATYDAAQEIRQKKITREEGVKLVKKFDHEFPKKYFKEFLNYINITEKQFWILVNSYRSPHLWEFKKGNWHLKHSVN